MGNHILGMCGPGWSTRRIEGGALHVATAGDAHLGFAAAVVRGLQQTPRRLPPRFLYDAAGSALYEDITAQPEYYPMRAEERLVEDVAPFLARQFRDHKWIELGSGSSLKTRHFLDALPPTATYIPVDVSASALEGAIHELSVRYQNMHLEGVASTFEQALPLFADVQPKVLLFLGSTLGNFDPASAEQFLGAVAQVMRADDHFVLGVDCTKDPERIDAAYNDAARITDAFIRNVLVRMNRELDAGIDVDAVSYNAFFNRHRRVVEMWLTFNTAQTLRVPALDAWFALGPGERILVEESRKFVVDDVIDMGRSAGLECVERAPSSPADHVLFSFRRSPSVACGGRAPRVGARDLSAVRLVPCTSVDPTSTPATFRMAQWPVTVRQYRRFVDAGGYADGRFWTSAGEAWKAQTGTTAPEAWAKQAAADSRRPVVGVCFYEAQAYARWAEARLPTAAEWRKAAVWDPEAVSERPFPWGHARWSATRANAAGAFGTLGPVGAFDAGMSFFGVHEMWGSVWEWCDDGAAYGGAFDTPEQELVDVPSATLSVDARQNNVGFRVVIPSAT